MNVLSKITRRQLAGNRTRTAVTVIGIILSVAMITAVTTLMASLYDYGVRAAKDIRGNWYAKLGAANSEVVQRLAADERVEDIFFMRYDGCELTDPTMTAKTPFIAVSAVSPEFFDNMGIALAAGRLPENGTEVVLPNGDEAEIGTEVTIDLGERTRHGAPLYRTDSLSVKETWEPGEKRTYTVVGIYTPNRAEENSGPCYNYITVIEGDPVAGANAGGRRVDVFIRTYKPMDATAVYDEITAPGVNKEVGVILSDSYINGDLFQYLDVSQLVRNAFFILGVLMLGVITAGSVLMISNAFMISAAERRRQFGLLSSVGATAKQIRKSVFLEGAYLLIPSLPIGMLLGISAVGAGLGALRGLVLQVTGNKNVTLHLHVSLPALAAAAVIGAVTVFVSALHPARVAAGAGAIELIRRSDDNERLIHASRKSCLGIVGKIARNYDKRDRRRRVSTVLSLALSVMLFLLTCSLALSMREYLEAQSMSRGDVWVYYRNYDAPAVFDFYRECTDDKRINKSALNVCVSSGRIYADSAMLTGAALTEDGSAPKCSVLILDNDSYLAFLEAAGLSRAGLYDTDRPVAIGLCGRTHRESDRSPYITSRDFTGVTGEIRFGEGYRVETSTGLITRDDGTAEMPGTHYPDNTLFLAAFTDVVPWGEVRVSSEPRIVISEKTLFVFGEDTFLRHAGLEAYLSCLTDRHNEVAQDLLRKLESAEDIRQPYYVTDELDGRDTGRSRIVIAQVLSYGLTLLMALVTVANVMNTVSSGVTLRTRDFAVLRSLGMSGKDFRRLRIIESLGYSSKAVLPAVALSLGMLAVLGYLLPDTTVVMPWIEAVCAAAVVFLILLVTEKAAFDRIMRGNTADEIRMENV